MKPTNEICDPAILARVEFWNFFVIFMQLALNGLASSTMDAQVAAFQ
jgi:hypothetical protein